MRGSAKTPFQKEHEPNLRQTAPPRASYKGPKACDVESDPFESVYGQDPRMAGEDPFDIATTAKRCLPTRRGLRVAAVASAPTSRCGNHAFRFANGLIFVPGSASALPADR